MAGGFLSVQLLCNTAPESVLPPVDRGDVPSPLGVLDAVWWSAVCDLDAAMLRKFCHAVRGLQVESLATPPASFPLDLGYAGCLLGHHWYGDGVFDVDDWGRRVRPSCTTFCGTTRAHMGVASAWPCAPGCAFPSSP